MTHTSFKAAFGLTAALAAAASSQAQQRLLVPESTNDQIMEFDPMTGALMNMNAIDLAALTGGAAATPIEVRQAPNGELWISDQTADTIFRLNSDGTAFLGAAAVALDNCRGFEIDASGAYISNAGANNGAPDDAVVTADLAGNGTGFTPITNPFDVLSYTFNGVPGYLVCDITNEDLVFCEGANLANQTIFHDSDGLTGIDFCEQMSIASNGNVLAAGFSAPSGIYEYDATGAQVNYIDTSALAGLSGLRGVVELGNGNLLFTNGGGVHIYDVVAGTITTEVAGVSGRFCSIVGGGPGSIGTNYCSTSANSTGVAASISATGSSSAAANDVTLLASDVPVAQFGIFITSMMSDMTPVANGTLCLGGSLGRYSMPGQIQQADMNGQFSLALDLTQTPQGLGSVPINAGETWYFQAWFRDSAAGGAGANFTDGYQIDFN